MTTEIVFNDGCKATVERGHVRVKRLVPSGIEGLFAAKEYDMSDMDNIGAVGMADSGKSFPINGDQTVSGEEAGLTGIISVTHLRTD